MYKTLFPTAREVAYLDTAAEGLPLPQCADAFREYYDAKSYGTPGRREFRKVESETAELAAALLGTEVANVAFLSSASEALNALAASLKWKSGDQIILTDLEFPSNVVPWLRLKEVGVQVIVVPSRDGVLRWEDVAEKITPRTRLVSLSLVSYKTGTYLPFVEKIGREARRMGAIVSIDATQAFGRCPIRLEGVDYLMSSTYKWLLGPHGLGIVYLSPEFREKFTPGNVGWYSVKNIFSKDRFEHYEVKGGAACLTAGMPNYPGIYSLRESLRFLQQIGVSTVYQKLKPLMRELHDGLNHLGVKLLTPCEEELASGIISFAHPYAEEIGAALNQEGTIVWAGDGRVRASVHLYNDDADIDRYLSTLKSLLAKMDVTCA